LGRGETRRRKQKVESRMLNPQRSARTRIMVRSLERPFLARKHDIVGGGGGTTNEIEKDSLCKEHTAHDEREFRVSI